MDNGIYIVIPFATKEKAEQRMDEIWERIGLSGQIISDPQLDEIYSKRDKGNG